MNTLALRLSTQRPIIGWRPCLDKSAGYIAFLAAALALALVWSPPRHATIYFLEQDAALLVLCAAGLALLARARFSEHPLDAVQPPLRWAIITGAALLAYFGSHWWLGQYAISRDEQLAEFAAEYLRRGMLGAPIPLGLRSLATAVMPLWADRFVQQGYWVSGYLPVNSLVRAGFLAIGDGRLSSPFFLILGALGLWSAARRLWPTQPRASTVALVLLLTSAQVLANAMTAYAMTGHLALNALWLACFLRGDKRGHGAAIAIGIFATGLHQFHFHVLFVSGFIIWLFWQKQRQLALFYFGACAAYCYIWLNLYPFLLTHMLGQPPIISGAAGSSKLIVRLQRLAEMEPGTSLARFIAWQNLLLVPLFVVGARFALSPEGRRTPLAALTFTCFIGLATMVFQGHGYGYRYLHGTIPAFCLVAAGGWLSLEREAGRPLPQGLLWCAAAIALSVTLPFALWRSQQFDAPYVSAYHAVRAAPTDVVLVDRTSGAWMQDIVRVDPAFPKPLLLDLGNVPADVLTRLCATKRVMIFGDRQARVLGLRQMVYATSDDPTFARQRQLASLRCGEPVPIPRQ